MNSPPVSPPSPSARGVGDEGGGGERDGASGEGGGGEGGGGGGEGAGGGEGGGGEGGGGSGGGGDGASVPPITTLPLPAGLEWPDNPTAGNWQVEVIWEAWKLIGQVAGRLEPEVDITNQDDAAFYHTVSSLTKAFRVSPALRVAFGYPVPQASIHGETVAERRNHNFHTRLFGEMQQGDRVRYTQFESYMKSKSYSPG